MPRINLLPWRAEQRKERKLAFMVALGGATVGAIVAMGAVYLMFSSMIDGQERRNGRLRDEIKLVDRQIEEINSLETQKQRFISRMQIIEKLQRSRPEVVHVFDEIVHTLPDGAYLISLKQTDRHLKIDGIAQSSTRVASFMRNIDGSQWLKNPELETVETKKDAVLGSNFTLYADQVTSAGSDAAEAPQRAAVPRKGSTP
jgi:type IV pilus assembly protein PilN